MASTTTPPAPKAPRPSPLVLQKLQYPAKPYGDFPTAPMPPDVVDGENDGTQHVHLGPLARMRPFAHDDKWVVDGRTAADPLHALPHFPANTCYRNAALAALLNLPPFLNFLSVCESIWRLAGL